MEPLQGRCRESQERLPGALISPQKLYPGIVSQELFIAAFAYLHHLDPTFRRQLRYVIKRHTNGISERFVLSLNKLGKIGRHVLVGNADLMMVCAEFGGGFPGKFKLVVPLQVLYPYAECVDWRGSFRC